MSSIWMETGNQLAKKPSKNRDIKYHVIYYYPFIPSLYITVTPSHFFGYAKYSEQVSRHWNFYLTSFSVFQMWAIWPKIRWSRRNYLLNLRNPSQVNVPYIYPLKTLENQRFPDVFREDRNEILAWNGIISETLVEFVGQNLIWVSVLILGLINVRSLDTVPLILLKLCLP